VPPVRRRGLVILLAGAALAGAPALAQEQVGRSTGLTPMGRQLAPVGRQVQLGTFPTGGAISPDGRFYWAVDAGRGTTTAVRIVELAKDKVVQTLPIPGGYVGVAFSPDGHFAFVSGERADGTPPPGTKGADGDVIHVFAVAKGGRAVEQGPITISGTRDGQAARDELPPSSNVKAWPEGLAVTPDGKLLVVALGQADQAAIVDLATHHVTLANVGRYPYGVAVDPRRPRAYVTSEYDGTVTALDLPSGRVAGTVGVGGPAGDRYAHAQGIAADPARDMVYVAVTNRDLVAAVDTRALRVDRLVPVRRAEAGGSSPVAVAVAPDARTLYVANANEDALVGIALADRGPLGSVARTVVQVRGVGSIARYRAAVARAARARDRARRTATARRRFAAAVRRAQRNLLFGRRTRACTGPTVAQDRRYARAVLRAYAARDRARARRVPRRVAVRRFLAAVRRAQRALPRLRFCPPPGDLPGLRRYDVIGRLPTAWYPTGVDVSPNGRQLVWLTGRGYGSGPNANGTEISSTFLGRAGVLDRPSDRALRDLTALADRQVVPSNARPAPPGTPVVGPNGGASEHIKHVFYVVKENRTYDQIFGSDPRGDGDPRLQLFDDNGVPPPIGGVTPNAHALTRTFPLLDNVMADSENSTDGHKITSGSLSTDYTNRYVSSSRGRRGNPDIFPIGVPPNGFVFDQAVRQGVSFQNFGELGAGNQPFADDGRPTFQAVFRGTHPQYPSQVQGSCEPAYPLPAGTPLAVRCTADSGRVGATSGPAVAVSRIDTFAQDFQAQVAAGTVPTFTYMILFNDHTNGTDPGVFTPQAQVADNDLALGQLVELVSQSSLWASSAIFVQEDDSQSGTDHVDAHRMPAYVISPWAKRGAVVHTRYDQYSFLRTAELIAGLQPLTIDDALATPLYDAFVSGGEPAVVAATRYHAIQPEQDLNAVNSASASDARLSRQLPWSSVDLVPQTLSDRILWHSVYGPASTPPPPGPNASPVELARATAALRAYRAGASVRAVLAR
jgi:DNA-binding beta-propeller fold protein YncE